MTALESKTALYFASLQIDWIEEMAHADIHIIPLESSVEDNEDVQFFEQEPLQDNGEFMSMIWKGLKKTYKLVNDLHKKKKSSLFLGLFFFSLFFFYLFSKK